MKYCIASASDPDGLSEMVNKLIGDGWVPAGGVAVSDYDFLSEDRKGYREDNYNSTFSQAMTKPS